MLKWVKGSKTVFLIEIGPMVHDLWNSRVLGNTYIFTLIITCFCENLTIGQKTQNVPLKNVCNLLQVMITVYFNSNKVSPSVLPLWCQFCSFYLLESCGQIFFLHMLLAEHYSITPPTLATSLHWLHANIYTVQCNICVKFSAVQCIASI